MCVKLPPSVIVLLPLFIPVPPYVGSTIVPCQTPVPIVPTCCRLLLTTAPPSVVLLSTSASLIKYAFPLAKLKSSDESQLVFALSQVSVAFAPSTVIPAPFAAAPLAAPLATTMLRSSTVSVVLLIVVVSPLTVKSPVTIKSCPIVVAPPPSPPVPILIVVPAAAMLTVVGVANKLNVL